MIFDFLLWKPILSIANLQIGEDMYPTGAPQMSVVVQTLVLKM